MMHAEETNIMKSRLYPPKSGGEYIRREALRKKMIGSLKNSLILICAPAGYGKTSLVNDLISVTDFEYSWLGVHSDMKNYYTFVTYLVHSIRLKNPDFGSFILTLIKEYRERMNLSNNRERIVKEISEALVSELNEAFGQSGGKNDGYTLIIDDLGNIPDAEWTRQFFNTIFENISPGIRFIITSRSVPDFNLSVLTAKRNILRIESKELAFTSEETGKLLKNIYNIAANFSDVHALTENLNGWVTGLHLIIQSYGKGFSELRLDKIVILDDIFNYFTEDIFGGLDRETQDFLTKTCLLDSFSAELCNDLLPGINSLNLINNLLKQNIFIFEISDPGNINNVIKYYSYQRLFKSFLVEKAKKSVSKEESEQIFKKASEHFLAAGEYDKAIKCSLRSGNSELSAAMIKRHYRTFFTPENFEVLWEWLEFTDDETVSAKPFLLYLRSNLQAVFKGDIENSNRSLDKIFSLINKADDPELFSNCCVLKARNLIRLGNISEVIEFLIASVSQIKDENGRIKLLFLTAYAHYQNSDYEKSLTLLDKSSEIMNTTKIDPEIKETILNIYNLYGNIYLIRGDYSKSIAYYEYALKNDEKIFDRFEAFCNLVLLNSQCGRFDKATQYLARAGELAEKVRIPIFRIGLLLAKQGLLFEYGDYEGNIKVLEEINSISFKINHKYYIFLSYSLIGDSYYSLSKYSKAEEYYDLAFKHLNDKNRLEQVQYMVSKALLVKKTEPEIQKVCEEVLLEAYEFYKMNNFTYNTAQTAFHLADYYLRKNEQLNATRYLKECLGISSEKEYTSYLEKELPGSRSLFDFAEMNNLNTDFINFLKDSFINKKDESWTSEECKRRIRKEIFEFYDIRAELFGKPLIYFRGELCDESEWSKKKWKLIFIDLLLSRRKELTKDRIIDSYYPDTSPDSAENIFHQMISKFRGLTRNINYFSPADVKPGTKKTKNIKKGSGKTIQFITYEDKTLRLYRNLLVYADCSQFEKFYRDYLAAKEDQERMGLLKKAIGLYRGDFMEGNYETWVEEIRSKYHSQFVKASEDLIKMLYLRGDFEGTLYYAENLLKHDKLNFRSYVYIINSHAKKNELNLAMEIYSILEKKYNSEYGEELPKSIIKDISISSN
jgi:ATP/maltotriose-dependent transcriptional regulator MalT/DNA-binding SARP family transcriptional activator